MMITSLVLVARWGDEEIGEIGELSEPAVRVVCWVGKVGWNRLTSGC